jgi:uncharacterized membrane protein YphA (DoxX/SURF4 family)
MTAFIDIVLRFCIFSVRACWTEFPSHLLWLAILLFILMRGPGPILLDALLRQRA